MERSYTRSSNGIHLPGTVRRIAVLRALYLGDLLCATPALRALDRRFPHAEITLIGLPWTREFADRLGYIDHLQSFPGYPDIPETQYDPERTNAFFARARQEHYDLAIQMHGAGGASNGFVADLGARITYGYVSGTDDRLTLSYPYQQHENEVRRWLRLVEALPGESTSPPLPNPDALALDFPITPEENARASELLPTPAIATRVGLHPGSKLPDRRWPVERFAALADTLIERYRVNIVITGTEEERPLATAIRRQMRYPALDLTGRTDIGTFAAVMRRLDLIVTNDTGASHVAAATGTRSVVLFGPTRPEQWAPLERDHHAAVDALDFVKPETEPALALQQLPIEPVLTACTRQLASLIDYRRPGAHFLPRVSPHETGHDREPS